jgi:hypothetical protein
MAFGLATAGEAHAFDREYWRRFLKKGALSEVARLQVQVSSVDSRMITPAMSSVACTMIGAMALGKRWRKMMRPSAFRT